jgi:cytochrome c-type biogenesis protein CcmH/NrfF
VWILPIAALLTGLAVVMRRVRRSGDDARDDAPPVDPDLETYLEQVRREVGS